MQCLIHISLPIEENVQAEEADIDDLVELLKRKSDSSTVAPTCISSVVNIFLIITCHAVIIQKEDILCFYTHVLVIILCILLMISTNQLFLFLFSFK